MNRTLPNGWTFYERPKQSKLQKLISEKNYTAALTALQQSKKDHGYTDEWYKERLWKLNKEWLSEVRAAVADNNHCMTEIQNQIAQVRNTRFQYNYTEREYADLQFMQTLIKTRIINEGQDDAGRINGILDEFINTQEGARAIMFLSGDSEVGKFAKTRYEMAVKNSKTAAERQFDADKAAKLDKLNGELIPYFQASIIGGKMLERAESQVNTDMAEWAGTFYFREDNTAPFVFPQGATMGTMGIIPCEVQQETAEQVVKQAESPCTLAQSTQEDSVNPTLSQRETSEIAVDDVPPVTAADSAENSEIRHESAQNNPSKSNFANASIF